jgi:serine/threonine-protein kinase
MSAAWPEELPPGFEFERYTIVECVWCGNVASVYRASTPRGKYSQVALKVFDRTTPDRLANFRRRSRNARTAAAVRHPNLATIIALGVWQERPFVVTEWLDGRDLEEYLDRWGVMAEDEVAELGLHLIAGLMALHDAGAEHGDLKPSSVFLSDGWESDVIPKLLLSELPQLNALASPVDSTTRQIVIGSPAYTPPEAVRQKGRGPTGDQYSLAAVLYECAVGQAPFVGDTPLELLRAIALGTFAAPRSLRPELSEALEATLLRALEKDPAARFASLRDMGRALWPLASDHAKDAWATTFGTFDGAPPAGGAGAAMRVRVRARRAPVSARPAALLLLVASIALSLGLGAFYFFNTRGDSQPSPPRSDPSAPTPNARF